ncbi:MAG: sulfurtransferase [Chloroflexi bacterium]|nr:sulfurtransferase [Chloroflexota bacterium]
MRSLLSRLVLIAIVLPLTGTLTPMPTSAEPIGSPSFLVTGSWVAQLGNSPDVVIVDARPPDAYAQGHIPGAVNLPSPSLATRSSEEIETGPWRDRTVGQLGALGITPSNMVVAYDDQGSYFAARARWALKHLGHERAVILDGGLSAWTKLGQPLSTDAPARAPTTYTGTTDPERLATAQYIRDRLGNPGVQILDVRTLAMYTGEDPGTFKRSGHIPTALHLDWVNNVQAESPRTFKSLAEIQALYDGIGLDRNKEIIVYCNGGVWSANTLFVLEMLGYPRVRLYSASWGEWGNRDDLPIAIGPEPGAAPN